MDFLFKFEEVEFSEMQLETEVDAELLPLFTLPNLRNLESAIEINANRI